MKYEVSVTINKSIDEVVSVLRSREHSLKWIKNLKEFELMHGEMYSLNSKYKMVFKGKKKDTVMFETITEFDPPHKITTVYEAGSVWNECINLFHGHDDHTHYKMKTEFKFPWYMSVFIWMFKPMFKNETLKGLNDFKKYIESL